MKNKVTSQLWIYLTLLIFFSLVLSTLAFFALMYLLTSLQIIDTNNFRAVPILLIFGSFSILIGTIVSAFVVHRVLHPIMILRTNMEKVAKRDFTIQLNQHQSIKEVQKLYTSFNTMVRELNSVETLRNEFTTTVSHEFKTPVSTIQGYVQLLQNSELSQAEVQDYYKRILNGTQQLSTLSDNILNLTKLNNENFVLDKKNFRLDEQIREVILFLQPKWEKKQLEWTFDLETVNIDGDEEFLHQVWLNLIDNAIKYNKVGGMATVTLTKDETDCYIEIKDSGIGMTEETTQKMFERFYQEDTTRKTQGNGLGLSLVKEIIDLHEGEIMAESKPGAGTKFCVQLPL